ncbi:MAG: LamG domain-containing protein [Nanoarchaeota archaeon]
MERGLALKEKRGMSEVIATLIIILLVIVAILVVWGVVRNVIDTGAEQITLDKFTINIELEKAVVSQNSIDVTVKRNPGQGELSGFRFVISDGTNSQIIDSTATLSELEQKTISLNYVGIVKSVGVAPIIKQGTSTAVQEVKDTIEFSSKDAVKNTNGLVSWWRFEGNANDEMGLNDGTPMAGATLAQGRFGQGYKFDQTPERIEIQDSASLQLEQKNMTIIAWINIQDSSTLRPIMDKKNIFDPSGEGYGMLAQGINPTSFFPVFSVNFQQAYSASSPHSAGQWIQVAASQHINSTGSTKRIYTNGNFEGQSIFAPVAGDSTGYNLIIGYYSGAFGDWTANGTIDEVMIFSRSLSDQEIQAIYNLDLND